MPSNAFGIENEPQEAFVQGFYICHVFLSNILNIFLILLQDERNQILTAYLWIRQVWFDAHLKWNKDDYDGLDTIRIPSSYVWRPDIVLYNK